MHSSDLQTQNKTSSYHVWVGQIILWSGFLTAAFAAVSKIQQPNKWETIPWGIYIPALGIGFAGIMISKARSQSDADALDTDHSAYAIAETNLHLLLALIKDAKQYPDRAPKQTLYWIDEHCANPLAEFANSRQSIANRFGMNTYCEIMTEFASAERSINRTWSAAADGYIDEVNRCIGIANEHLERAEQLLRRAEESEDKSAV